MRHHDLLIVGTGSGNSIVDDRFSHLDVAIVEQGTFGGTCLNVGCIPTKMFVHTADLASATRGSARFGVDAHVDKVRWIDIRDRIFGRIDPISAAGASYRRESNHVTVYDEHARFTGARRLVLAGGQELEADRIVIAAGSRAVIPDVPGLAETAFHTSDTVMRIDALPASIVVLGGGVIAAEMAHVFSALGTRVTVIARSPRLLMAEDRDVSERFTDLAGRRWDLRVSTQVLKVEDVGGTSRLHLASAEDHTDRGSVDTEVVLVATGRVPNADRLEVAASGVTTHSDGRVIVDAQQRTVVPGIWALGDVSSLYQLKHVANHEARVVQHNLLHPESPIMSDHRYVPHAIFTSPQIAAVGSTEAELLSSGTAYLTGMEGYGSIAYGWAMEDTTGFAKVLADPASGLLLGAHIIGPQASSVIQPLIQAMHFGLPALEMARGQYWIHPAMPEVVENALLNLA
ncbi:MAG: mycothione reductase [Nocardioidaceae bacterium]